MKQVATERVWLDVPFADKDKAKAAGARWDSDARRWFAPAGLTSELSPWAAMPDLPAVFPGEDRTFGDGLFVDLVPHSCWFTNVRYCIRPMDWERVRRMVVGRAANRCEACGCPPDRQAQWWMEAHERWSYDELTGVQRLVRLVCLCTPCHETTHFGLAQVRGRDQRAFEHLVRVTGMNEGEATRHVRQAFNVWEQRNRRSWELDLRILTDAGVTLNPPPSAMDRAEIAARLPWDG